MPESPGGVDIATLGLRVDASQFVEANKQQEAFVRTGEKVEAQAKRLTDASTQRARAVESEAQRIQRLQVQEEAAAQAHQNFLQRRQQQEAQAAQSSVAQAAEAGRQQALAQADAAERTYLRRVNQLKLAQAQGLLGPREAQEAAVEFAQAYNQAIAGAISTAEAGTFVGAQGEDTFNRLAGSLKNVEQESKGAGLGMGRLNRTMASVLRQATGTHPVVGQLANVIGSMALGGVVMGGALAGLAAVGVAYRKLTEDAREARKEQERAIESLRQLQEAQRLRGLGPGAEEAEQAALVRDRIRETEALIETLEERLRVEQDLARFASQEDFGPGLAAITALEGRVRSLRDSVAELNEQAAAGEEAARQARSAASRRRGRVAADILDTQGQDEAAEALRDQLDILELIADGASQAEIDATRRLQALEAQARALEKSKRRQEEARKAQEEARKEADAELQTLTRAIDLRVEQRSDLERLLEIQQDLLGLSEDENRSRREQVDAAEDLLAVTRLIETFRRRNVSLDSDIGERPIGVPGAAPRDRLDLDFGGLDDFEARIQRSVNLANLSIGSLADEIDGLAVADAVASGLVAVADGLGLVGSEARGAARGIRDVLGGIQGFKAARAAQKAGTEGANLALAGSALGVAGGVAGLLSGLAGIFDNSAARAAEEARNRLLEDNNRRLEDLASALRDQSRTAAQFREGSGLSADALQALSDNTQLRLSREGGGLFGGLEEGLAEVGVSLRELERLARDAGITIFDEFGRIIPDALVQLGEAAELMAQQIEEAQAAFRQELEVRRLSALGRDEEAAALRRQMENEAEIREAQKQGFDGATIAALKHVQALEEEARAQEEAARAAEEAAERMRNFDAAFSAAMAERARRTGDFDALLNIGEADIQRQLEPFRELVEAGLITEDAFTLLAATMRGNVVAAIEEQERAWREANQQFLRDVEARERALAGDDRGALEAQLRADAEAEKFRAREMLIAGQITQEAFDRLVAVLEGEVVAALEEFDQAAREAARAAREAAEAERFRAQVDLENLRIRLLVAQGRDAEAQALRDQLEILQAVEEGRSAEYIALLRQVQAAEATRRATEKRTEAERDLRKELELTSRVFNAPAGFSRTLARLRQQASEFSNPVELPGGGTFGGSQSVASRAADDLDTESVEVTPEFDVVDPGPIPVEPTFLLVDPDPLSVSPEVEVQDPDPLPVEPSFALIEPDPLEVQPRLDMEDPEPLAVEPSFALVEPDPLRVEPALEQVPPDPISVEPAFALVPPEPMQVEPAFDLVPPEPAQFTPVVEMTEPDPLAVDPVFEVPDVDPVEVTPDFVALPGEPLAVRPDFAALPPETLEVRPDLDLLPPDRLPVEPAFDLLDPDPLRVTPEFEVERTPPIQLAPEFDLGGLPELLAERTVFGVRAPDFGSRESESTGPSPDRQPPRTANRERAPTQVFNLNGDFVVPVQPGQDAAQILDEILREAQRRALAGGGNVFEEQFE